MLEIRELHVSYDGINYIKIFEETSVKWFKEDGYNKRVVCDMPISSKLEKVFGHIQIN